MFGVFDVFSVFNVFDVFDAFGVFDVFEVFDVQKIYHVFDVFTCLGNFFSKKYSMCLTCLAFLRVSQICSPKNIPCV